MLDPLLGPAPIAAPATASPPTPPPNSASGPQPRTVSEALSPAVEVVEETQAEQQFPLDLTSALYMVAGQNPVVAHAASRYHEAVARHQAAQAMWLPSLRAGASYHHHDGNLQGSNGLVVDVDRTSMQGGLGVQAVGAGTTPVPGVVAQFHLSDAVYQPRITSHAASARAHGIDASTHDALLAAALAYLELLRAEQTAAIAAETLQRAADLAKVTQAYADSGQGSPAEADRARTELELQTNQQQRARESIAVANARLLEALSLDPYVHVTPAEETIVPIDLVPDETPVDELLAVGLSNRPELSEAQHLVCEALQRHQRERYAPFLPSVLLGVSQSSFAGAPGGALDVTGPRFDFDAAAFWELRNFGVGERAARDATWAAYEQRQLEQVRWLDRVAREISEAHAQVRSRKQQIAVAERAVAAARQSYDRNRRRIHDGVGLPLEVLQSIQALDLAQRDYLRSVADYNEAQFRLQRALGWAIR